MHVQKWKFRGKSNKFSKKYFFHIVTFSFSPHTNKSTNNNYTLQDFTYTRGPFILESQICPVSLLYLSIYSSLEKIIVVPFVVPFMQSPSNLYIFYIRPRRLFFFFKNFFLLLACCAIPHQWCLRNRTFDSNLHWAVYIWPIFLISVFQYFKIYCKGITMQW